MKAIESILKGLQSKNVRKVVFSQGLDHFNSPRVPCNGYKWATKDTKPKWERGVQKWTQALHFKVHIPSNPLGKLVAIKQLKNTSIAIRQSKNI